MTPDTPALGHSGELRDAIARAIYEADSLVEPYEPSTSWKQLEEGQREDYRVLADAVLGVLAVHVEERWGAMVEAGAKAAFVVATSRGQVQFPWEDEGLEQTRDIYRRNASPALRAALSELGVGGSTVSDDARVDEGRIEAAGQAIALCLMGSERICENPVRFRCEGCGEEHDDGPDHVARAALAAADRYDAENGTGGKRRASSLSPPEFYALTLWGRDLYEAFEVMPYLVGSCQRAEDYRDVDVRMLLTPESNLHRITKPGREHLLLLLNAAISRWGREVTNLPIDFQFQDRDEANAEYGDQPRNPIGRHAAERLPNGGRDV